MKNEGIDLDLMCWFSLQNTIPCRNIKDFPTIHTPEALNFYKNPQQPIL